MRLGLFGQHLLLGFCQHTIEPAQHRERQDHVLILAALEGVADQVGDAPEEADDLVVVHRGRSLTRISGILLAKH